MDSGADALHADRYKASVIRILQIDDTSFFNIYQIAETFGWHVFITFKEKKSTEPKLETKSKAVKPVAEKVSK